MQLDLMEKIATNYICQVLSEPEKRNLALSSVSNFIFHLYFSSVFILLQENSENVFSFRLGSRHKPQKYSEQRLAIVQLCVQYMSRALLNNKCIFNLTAIK